MQTFCDSLVLLMLSSSFIFEKKGLFIPITAVALATRMRSRSSSRPISCLELDDTIFLARGLCVQLLLICAGKSGASFERSSS